MKKKIDVTRLVNLPLYFLDLFKNVFFDILTL